MAAGQVVIQCIVIGSDGDRVVFTWWETAYIQGENGRVSCMDNYGDRVSTSRPLASLTRTEYVLSNSRSSLHESCL